MKARLQEEACRGYKLCPQGTDLPIWIILPIDALSAVGFAINFGLVADQTSVEICDTVQFMRQTDFWGVMLVTSDAGVAPIGRIGVDSDLFPHFSCIVGAIIVDINNRPFPPRCFQGHRGCLWDLQLVLREPPVHIVGNGVSFVQVALKCCLHMEQQGFSGVASGTGDLVDIGEGEEFVVHQFLVAMEYHADEQNWGEDKMASEQNLAYPAGSEADSNACA